MSRHDRFCLTKNSIEFEKCAEKSFNLLGFKARWLPDENENNPDVILEAWNCINKYIEQFMPFFHMINPLTLSLISFKIIFYPIRNFLKNEIFIVFSN